MADLHYHICSTCSESFECELELGDCPSPALCVSHKGKLKFKAYATRSDAFLCSNGWICECQRTNAVEHEQCPNCGRPTPTVEGWHDRHLGPDYTEVEAEPEKGWTCPNCGNDYSGDSPEHDHSQSCHIKSCGEQFCGECGYFCQDCERYVCEDHHYNCQCCDKTVCYNCRDNHGT